MSTVSLKLESGIAHVELNRPAVRNALNLEMVRALHGVLDDLSQRDAVRVVVISGAGGKAFASGADIGELRNRTHRDAFLTFNGSLFQKVEDFLHPTIAAIEGYALGGGLELALACDLRVASKTAKVGLPEATLGIYPAAGGTWRLPRLIGIGRAKDLVFTGRILDSAEAFSLGIFERLSEPGEAVATAMELAATIAQNAPLALQVAKLSLNLVARGGDPTPLERAGQGLLFDSADKRERMSAFLSKRAKK